MTHFQKQTATMILVVVHILCHTCFAHFLASYPVAATQEVVSDHPRGSAREENSIVKHNRLHGGSTEHHRSPGHVRISGRHPTERRDKEYYEIDEIMRSGEFFDWALFLVVFAGFVCVRRAMCKEPGAVGLDVASTFLLWLTFGMAYNFLIFWRWGADTGILWFDGFVLELVFSLENVFFFYAVAEAFAAPSFGVYKALVLVVYWQNLYDLVLYVGLAHFLDNLVFLPYALSIWMALAGLHSLYHLAAEMHPNAVWERLRTPDSSEPLLSSNLSGNARLSVRTGADDSLMESIPVRLMQRLLGQRLVAHYDEHSPQLFLLREDGLLKMSLLLVVVLFLIAADSLLEIDVTLTKIETLQHPYVCFTSSALASFAMPELFFCTWKLSILCPLVKFGIAFVMLFFAGEVFFSQFIQIAPLDGCAIILCVLGLCVFLNEFGRTCFSASSPPTLLSK